MINGKKVVCIIPARLKSSRFPRKILAPLGNKPLIQWVWEAAMKIPFFDEVAFAIDSEETAEAIQSFGGHFHMTSPDCLVGTDRLIELHQKGIIQGDIWVNWQADEPFVSERILGDLLNLASESSADMWTLKTKILDETQINDPNCPKVTCDRKGFALYFSRSPIPYYRESGITSKTYFKHIGLYAYSSEALEKISSMGPCSLADAESLEQLRFLSHGLKIQVNETKEETIGIDLPEHLSIAEEFIKKYSSTPSFI